MQSSVNKHFKLTAARWLQTAAKTCCMSSYRSFQSRCSLPMSETHRLNHWHRTFIGHKLLCCNASQLQRRVKICISKQYTGTWSRTTMTTSILWSLPRPTCVSQHLQLRSGGFCRRKFTAHIPLLMAVGTLRFRKRCYSSQQCYWKPYCKSGSSR